jgi:hypothetical protein
MPIVPAQIAHVKHVAVSQLIPVIASADLRATLTAEKADDD